MSAPTLGNGAWAQPKAVDDITVAFPAGIGHLMPAMEEIPEEFQRDGSPWVHWQRQWFFRGLESFPAAKPGIDLETAIRHLAAIQGSFEPKHEHKEAAVAYLASLWLECSPAAPSGPLDTDGEGGERG